VIVVTASHVTLPLATCPVPALGWIRFVERKDRAADVARMEVDRRGMAVGVRVLEDDAHRFALHPLARRGEIVDLDDHHIARVAAAPREQSSGRSVVARGRDDLEEGVTGREHRIEESEHGDARIAEGDLEPEDRAEIGDGLVEVARQQRDLPQSHRIHSRRRSNPRAVSR
jgi:hypothetical protein